MTCLRSGSLLTKLHGIFSFFQYALDYAHGCEITRQLLELNSVIWSKLIMFLRVGLWFKSKAYSTGCYLSKRLTKIEQERPGTYFRSQQQIHKMVEMPIVLRCAWQTNITYMFLFRKAFHGWKIGDTQSHYQSYSKVLKQHFQEGLKPSNLPNDPAIPCWLSQRQNNLSAFPGTTQQWIELK